MPWGQTAHSCWSPGHPEHMAQDLAHSRCQRNMDDWLDDWRNEWLPEPPASSPVYCFNWLPLHWVEPHSFSGLCYMALFYLLQSAMFTLQAPDKYLITIKYSQTPNQNSRVPSPWFSSVCLCVYMCMCTYLYFHTRFPNRHGHRQKSTYVWMCPLYSFNKG